MDETKYKHQGFIGTALAEVLSIIIDTDAEGCELYGTIKAVDCHGSICMYDVEREDSESIKRNDSLFLTQGTRAICAERGFTVYFNLRDKERGDAEFICGQFSWEVSEDWNKRIVANVEGHFGSAARVEYAVFDAAIEANIWATFYNKDKTVSSCGLDLSGSIVARYKYRCGRPVCDKQDPNKYYEITMLDCGLTELDDQDLIPFYRSVVVVPAGYILSIEVNLEGNDTEGRPASWTGEVKLFPDEIIQATTDVELIGEYGVLKFGAVGFHYFDPLQHVESGKEIMRHNGWLLN